jgi:hypothetical protein
LSGMQAVCRAGMEDLCLLRREPEARFPHAGEETLAKLLWLRAVEFLSTWK